MKKLALKTVGQRLLLTIPFLSAFLIASTISSCSKTDAATTDYASKVDPFIGTGGHGHTFPGPVVPNGMIQPGPDTRINGWDACSGYHYTDSTINGFTQTHLSGTGCADMGDMLIMPFTGKPQMDPQIDTLQTRAFASEFSHADEISEPGYYSTLLKRYGIRTEISATTRAAIYRFTYPASTEPGIIIDLDYSINSQRNTAMGVVAEGDSALICYKNTRGWAGDNPVYMKVVFSKPFELEMLEDSVATASGRNVARCKAILRFPETKESETIMARLAISAVDAEGAAGNLQAEIPGWDFEGVKADARRRWNEVLAKVDIETPDKTDEKIFYTSLYHCFISPAMFTDVDGRFRSLDRSIGTTTPDKPVYTIYSMWDTHRALHPLLTIVAPGLNNQILNSLLMKYDQGGILPMWELVGNYTATMPGYHGVSLLADAWTKGIADFDIEHAFKAARRSAEGDTCGIHAPGFLRYAVMLPSKTYKNEFGFIPWDAEHESVAKGLEYAYDDYCVARLAEGAGDTTAMALFDERAQYFKNYFDPETKFMRGKDAQGRWHEPFNPRSSNHRADDYCEGTAWQWTWFVPQNVEGLIDLMGGKEAFVDRLDSLFVADSSLEGEMVSADISGLIGQYAHGNEPSHHITHLFNYANRPDRTQELVDQVLKEQYRAEPDGISGNEDCGQMSAWYVLNSLGFYQVCAGKPVYSIGRPWFPKAEIRLENGKKVSIIVENFSKENKYIRSVRLNGNYLSQPFFNHSDIVDGAEFIIEMTSEPQKTLSTSASK